MERARGSHIFQTLYVRTPRTESQLTMGEEASTNSDGNVVGKRERGKRVPQIGSPVEKYRPSLNRRFISFAEK